VIEDSQPRSETEREIRVFLPSGEQIEYYPEHVPVRGQSGATLSFAWEKNDGSIFSVAINTDNVVCIEMVTRREDQDQDILNHIEQAKSHDERR
jgi:hypothetical protein